MSLVVRVRAAPASQALRDEWPASDDHEDAESDTHESATKIKKEKGNKQKRGKARQQQQQLQQNS